MQYFNYSTKTFSIEGSERGDWFISQMSGKVYNLIQTRTGEKIIDSSYGSYSIVDDQIDRKQYIIAVNSVNNNVSKGDFDIYQVDFTE